MNNGNAILAIETSDKLCGACIYFSDDHYYSNKVLLKNSHSEKLFTLIDQLILTSNLKKEKLAAIAVSEGPGSFTGLRIGFSAAKGLAAGYGIPIIPVPTFEALAFQLSQILADGTGFIIANKVNKEEVYYAKFQVKCNNYIFTDSLGIQKKVDFVEYSKNLLVFGNIFPAESKERHTLSYPLPEFVAMWAAKFGKERRSEDFDFMEPNYLKNFIVRS